MNKQNLKLFSCLLIVLGLSLGAGAQDFGWMQPGVRVWYFGGTSGLTTSNAVEAYLITAIAGGDVQYLRHSALEFWTSPKPLQNLVAPVNKGSFWMHPTVLQTLASGEYWMDQEILTVTRQNYTYATLLSALGLPYNLLPSKALFDLQAQRQIVKITYTIADTYSIGRAFFDAETGLSILRDAIFEGYTVFFLLSEINYNFAQRMAFAEDGGPHCGFKSRAAETAFSGGGHTGGIVDIQSGVETRYGSQIEMWVSSTLNGPYGLKMASENYYFDGAVPIVRRINHDQAGTLLPDQWDPFGQHLWWWLPPNVTGAQANAVAGVSLAPQTINVLDVSMSKTADEPLTYTATGNPARFYFSTLWFDGYGYLTKFSAKDPTIGLDIDGDYLFANGTTVDGLSYYRNTMGLAVPGANKNDFNGDGHEDILWRYYGSGGYNYVWYMGQSGGTAGFQPMSSRMMNMFQSPESGKAYWDPREAGGFLDWSALKIYGDVREAGGHLTRTADKAYRDAWEAAGSRSRRKDRTITEGEFGRPGRVAKTPVLEDSAEDVVRTQALVVLGGAALAPILDTSWQIAGAGDFNRDLKVDILWRHYGTGENYVWYMDGVTVTGGVLLATISDTSWFVGGTGDFNGDGKVDILWRNYGTGLNYVWYMDGLTVTGGVLLPTISDTSWQIAGTGNFNADGKVDILWRHYGTGQNYVWYLDGVTVTGGVLLPTISDTSWQIGGTGDFSGDGKVDILWRHYGTGQNYIWYMDGVTVTAGELLIPIEDLNWRICNR